MSRLIRTKPRVRTRASAGSRCALAALCGLLLCAAAAAQRRPAARPSPSPAGARTTSSPVTTQGDAQTCARGATQSREAQTETQSEVQSADAEHADLAITANVTARELCFEIVPNPTVEFPGRPERKTVWAADRQNVPRPAQPFVTYRDIGVRLRIASVFADIDRIVAEALGERPVTDEQPPPVDTTPSAAPAPPPADATPAPVINTAPAAAGTTPTRNAAPAAHTAPARRPRRVGRP